ncbi:GNAT family N-acetyltransferase [Zavarzinia compransoris]|uniref:GNAT family N-acetyltransferase n=1 Tax=Zavarzinia compransoris TaxID=1264899 RepID=A0A317E946_9PROT|nr:GNAT family N-acetyltransferase [Zavarzinia compransoris]PWR23618.1 GNAT family N-acetyltransferase [Zavarzinia compransoris]TDP47836.1 putative acetyltransferase [Zavarzinia compransoris]
MSALVIGAEAPDQPDVLALIRALDAFHSDLYPAESNHFLDLEAMTAPAVSFIVARLDGQAVGCGALLRDARGFAEIKRMYVLPEARGHGLGRKLLEALIAIADGEGIRTLRLETGIRNREALGLYRALGFIERGPFGDYAEDPNSKFMERRLG